MRKTPKIPRWICDFTHPGYTNVLSFLPRCPRLYATETLFGDWDASVLLLAKDAAPTQVIRKLARREGNGAWRHAQRELGDKGGVRTNETLKKLADQLPGSKLYGSATANMLYDDPNWSRSLPSFLRGPLHEYLAKTLRWVIGKMPNLRTIACLGNEAWYLTSMVIGKPQQAGRSSDYRDNSLSLCGRVGERKIIATSLYHPAARASGSRMKTGWDSLKAILVE